MSRTLSGLSDLHLAAALSAHRSAVLGGRDTAETHASIALIRSEIGARDSAPVASAESARFTRETALAEYGRLAKSV